MDDHRKQWNERQKQLAAALKKKADHGRAVELFTIQHAAMHAPGLGQPGLWSLDAELLEGLPEEKARWLPPGGEHTIAWLVWHIARCEDITFNLLVARGRQVIDQDGWMERMRSGVYDTGNTMTPEEAARFSAEIDLAALRAYRAEVGRRTQEIAEGLPPGGFLRRVDPADVEKIREAGAVAEGAAYMLDYWGKQKVAGLILMPATRHLLIHLNEAVRLKAKKM